MPRLRTPLPRTRAREPLNEEGRRAFGPAASRRIRFDPLGDRADVGPLRALLALGHLVLDLLVLLEVPVAVTDDRAEVHENVVATVVLGDESEALLGVEPLHGSCAHPV